jgi:hypothetical protein
MHTDTAPADTTGDAREQRYDATIRAIDQAIASVLEMTREALVDRYDVRDLTEVADHLARARRYFGKHR